MDGFHDLGGRQGFGQITVEGKKEPFHADWEIKINAISGKLVARHIYNMDELVLVKKQDLANVVSEAVKAALESFEMKPSSSEQEVSTLIYGINGDVFF